MPKLTAVAEDTDIPTAISTSASGPMKIGVEGMGYSQEHPLKDQIAAAKFAPPASVRSRVGKGIKFTKASAGGGV